MGGQTYDDVNYLLVRTERTAGTFSMSAAGTALVGTTLKTYTKFAVLGAFIRMVSGGSVGSGTPKTLNIGRLNAGGTNSVHQKFTCTISAGASALNDTFDLSCTSPVTIASFGEAAVLNGSSATIADHGCVVGEIIWRYKLLPLGVETY